MSRKDPWYRQCKYETQLDAQGAKKVGVSWIPEKFAQVGKDIFFGKRSDPLEEREIWTVVAVGGRERESYLVEHQMDWKHQRKASDI